MKSNTMKQIFFIGILTVGATFYSLAQDGAMGGGTTEEKATAATERQKEKLGLDADQETKMYDINLKYIKEMEQIQAGGRSKSTMMKLRSMSGKMDKEVKEILTKDQYKEYKEMKDQRREEMKKRMRSR